MNRRRLAAGLAIALVAATAAGALLYASEMRRAYRRIAAGSAVLASRHGAIEFARGGPADAAAVLVIHGSGGGFDQGVLLAEALLGERLQWIAPSRFGYLRSALPQGANFDQQADAYAELLDRLGVERVAVVALSHGGPSALLFALRHPRRVSALVLVSCGVAAADDPAQRNADRKGEWLAGVFAHDPLYWLVSRLLRGRLLEAMGADDEVVARLAPEQRELADRIVAEMNPVAPRAAGVALDHRAALPGARIAAIGVPTLVVHAADDRLQLYRNAQFAAETIPGARLLRFERGGHLLVIVERQAVAAAVQAFIAAHP